MEAPTLGEWSHARPTQTIPSRRGQAAVPSEVKERAVRLVFETAAEQGEWHGAVGKVSKQLGIGPESLRHWVHQEEIERGTRPGLTSDERARMKELERENRELRRVGIEPSQARPIIRA